jgi:hypothetical protein
MREASRPPDCISLEAHRDRDHLIERWFRWGVVVALMALAVAGLGNLFGQRPSETSAAAPDATLTVTAPGALRSGLVFQGRFDIAAEGRIRRPTLLLERGWFESVTLNTVEPTPVEEVSVRRGVAFAFHPLPAGRTLTVYFQFQANTTAVGRRSQGVELRDGDRVLARIDRSVTMFP